MENNKCLCNGIDCIKASRPDNAVITTIYGSNKVKLVSGDIQTPVCNDCNEEQCTVRKLINIIFKK